MLCYCVSIATQSFAFLKTNPNLWFRPTPTRLPLSWGFGVNVRGPSIRTFGKRAVEMFLSNNGLEYILRAHQEVTLSPQNIARRNRINTDCGGTQDVKVTGEKTVFKAIARRASANS